MFSGRSRQGRNYFAPLVPLAASASVPSAHQGTTLPYSHDLVAPATAIGRDRDRSEPDALTWSAMPIRLTCGILKYPRPDSSADTRCKDCIILCDPTASSSSHPTCTPGASGGWTSCEWYRVTRWRANDSRVGRRRFVVHADRPCQAPDRDISGVLRRWQPARFQRSVRRSPHDRLASRREFGRLSMLERNSRRSA